MTSTDKHVLQKQRDTSIDLYRFVGSVLVILAHIYPKPALISQLRNFDVVLLVLTVGISYCISSSGKKLNYRTYILKRVKRLLVPAWSFLLIYITFFALVNLFANDSFGFTIKDLISSFCLVSGRPDTTGVGGMWIIGIYLMIGFTLPLMEKVYKTTSRFSWGGYTAYSSLY